MLDYIHWIWLSEALGVNNHIGDELFKHFGYNAKAIYEADMSEYERALSERILSRQREKIRPLLEKDLDEAKKIYDYCIHNGIGLLPACVKYYYPSQLRRIKGKPTLLYYRGKLMNIEEKLCVAMVGTRGMTEYGKRMAYTLSYDLAKSGAVIVSGMALGIDGMCHRGALDAGGYTVAVLGCGVDRVYPPQHNDLMDQILANGLIISEYKPFTSPSGWHFPKRNRIISGISQACIVVEGDTQSGAMITARNAIDQGRRVFAVPGKAGESSSSGTNSLIREGADMVVCAMDVLNKYNNAYTGKIDITVPKITKTVIDPETDTLEIPDAASGNSAKKPRAKRSAPPKTEKSPVKATDDAPASEPEQETEKGIVDIGIEEPKQNDPETEYAMNEYEQFIYDKINFDTPMAPDEFIDAGLPVHKVMVAITKLEIAGYLKSVSGGKFIKLK